MTNEALLPQLYEQITAEQARYRTWLLDQPPDIILDHAAEYTVREDIVMEMYSLDLTDAQARALLRSKTPLADICREWNKAETHRMDDVRDIIESRANNVLHKARQAQERRSER